MEQRLVVQAVLALVGLVLLLQVAYFTYKASPEPLQPLDPGALGPPVEIVMFGRYGRTANMIRALANLSIFAKNHNLTARASTVLTNMDNLVNEFDFDRIRSFGYDLQVDLRWHSDANSEAWCEIKDLSSEELQKCSSWKTVSIHIEYAFFVCPDRMEFLQFAESLDFAKPYKVAADRLLEKINLQPGKFIGIHHRSPKEFENWVLVKGSPIEGYMKRTLHMDYGLIQEIVAKAIPSQYQNQQIIFSSDGETPFVDDQFRRAGFLYLNDFSAAEEFSKLKRQILEAAVLTQASYFIGSSYSTFSGMMADYRVVRSLRNDNILSWPQIDNGTYEGYVRCGQFWTHCKPFTCGPAI